jgi:hypothetical protein
MSFYDKINNIINIINNKLYEILIKIEIENNKIENNEIEHNEIEHNEIEHNEIEHNKNENNEIGNKENDNTYIFNHLNDKKCSYIKHFKHASYYSCMSFKASFYFLVHAFYPDFYTETGSTTIDLLNNEIKKTI